MVMGGSLSSHHRKRKEYSGLLGMVTTMILLKSTFSHFWGAFYLTNCPYALNYLVCTVTLTVTMSLYWQWSQNSKNMRDSLYTSLMTIAGSGSCSYGTADVAHLLIVKLMGHSIYYFEALLPQCLVQQLPIYNCTTFTCHNHN